MDTKQLRALLRRAGHFPKPFGRVGHRVLRSDSIPEGMHEIAVEFCDVRTRKLFREIRTGMWQVPPTNAKRSPIDVRMDTVRELRNEIAALVVPLMSAGFLPMPEVWQKLLDDDLLCAESIAAAIATLVDGTNLTDNERWALVKLLAGPTLTTEALRTKLTKREIGKLSKPEPLGLGLIRPCGTGKKKRGRYELTDAGRRVAEQLQAAGA